MPSPSSSSLDHTSVLTQKLFAHAEERGSEVALVFPSLAGDTVELTWAELWDQVMRMTAHLMEIGCRPGDVALVMSSAPLDQAIAFLGLQACGALPTVLSYPSIKQTHEMFWRMFGPVLRESDAKFVLHSEQFAELLSSQAQLTRLVEIPKHGTLPRADVDFPPHDDQDLFWQFSSGTTGARKSVRITSSMFVSHSNAYLSVVKYEPGDRVMSWVPLYHDLGLVVSFLVPIYHGVFSLHLSPFEWLQKPSLLFKAIQDYSGTLVWMPNFAFSYCAQRIPEAEIPDGLDLRRMRAFICGGEPITMKAQDEFLERFGQYGAHRAQLQTIYGMAENTAAITHTELGQPRRRDRVERGTFLADHRAVAADAGMADSETLSFESCGRPVDDTEVRIGDGLPERHIGEILARGGSMFTGYSAQEGGTQGTKGSFTDDGWFRTGDLGYFAEGELFATGRAKDLIIHRGSNIYPADIEDVISRMEGVRAGRVVVFGVYDDQIGTEVVIAMAEPATGVEPSQYPEVVARIRSGVLSHFNFALTDVVVVERQSLLKSTSGKISRDGNKKTYLEQYRDANRDPATATAGQRDGGPTPRDLHERQVAQAWEEVLQRSDLSVRQDFFAELGGDSIGAVRVVELINEKFGTTLGPELLLEARTIEQQAAFVRDQDSSERILVKFHSGTKCPLFLAHPAGGSVFGYDGIARALPDRPVYGLQDPHIFASEGFFESIEEMAEAYLPHIREVRPHGPYMLGGWSLGGVLAWEMANRLVADGEEVANLILFDAASPATEAERRHLYKQFVPTRKLIMAMAKSPLLRRLLAPWTIHRKLAGADDIHRAREMARFDIDESPGTIELFFPNAPAELKRGGLDRLLADAVHLSEERDNIVPGISPRNHIHRRRIHQRNLTQLFRKYQPAWRYPGRTTLFRQSDEAVAPWRARGWASHYNWAQYCAGQLDVHIVELLATEAQPDPHDNTLLPINTERYMPAVREALDRSEPG